MSIPDRMQAAIFHGGSDIRVSEVPTPAPGPDEVLVRVEAAGICGSDLLAYRGAGPWQPDPAHPDGEGHELAGTVAAVGTAVHTVSVGDRVAVEPIHLVHCSVCEQCRTGRTHLCPQRGGGSPPQHSRGFAGYDLAPATRIYPLPESVAVEQAAILDCYACGVHALHLADIPPSTSVAVVGSGAIGQTLGQVAKAAGHHVTMLGHRAGTLQLALQAAAADEVIDTTTADGQAAAANRAARFSVVFDAAGAGSSLSESLQLLAPGGTVVVLGVYPDAPQFDPYLAYQREAAIRWSNSYGSCVAGISDFQRALDLLASGHLNASPLITHRVGLAEITTGFETLADRASNAVKVLVIPGGG